MSPETLRSALEGVNRMYLILSSDQESSLQTDSQIIELAKEAGIQRIVVLMDYEGNPLEYAIRECGLEWTLLKPVEFMGNVIDDWRQSIREKAVASSPFAHALSARVHEADIASVAVAALTEDGHAGQSYVLTGPEVKSRIEVIKQIGEAIGKDITFVEQSEEEARQGWREQGYEEGDIDFFIQMGKNPPEIGYTVVPTVEQVTGRPAKTFAQWLEENKHHFQ